MTCPVTRHGHCRDNRTAGIRDLAGKLPGSQKQAGVQARARTPALPVLPPTPALASRPKPPRAGVLECGNLGARLGHMST